MKKIRTILKWTLRAIAVLCVIFIGWVVMFILESTVFYEREMNRIKDKLNKLDNVEVVNIWGHEDLTLEHVTARIRIKDKGEIVLENLNSGDCRYPQSVDITEIGGYSFTSMWHDGGMGWGIDVGTESHLGRLIGKKFKTPKDVLDNYDVILTFIENLKISPEINHFETKDDEWYLLIENKKSTDQDKLLHGLDLYNKREFPNTLKWNRPDAYYHKSNP